MLEWSRSPTNPKRGAGLTESTSVMVPTTKSSAVLEEILRKGEGGMCFFFGLILPRKSAKSDARGSAKISLTHIIPSLSCLMVGNLRHRPGKFFIRMSKWEFLTILFRGMIQYWPTCASQPFRKISGSRGVADGAIVMPSTFQKIFVFHPEPEFSF